MNFLDGRKKLIWPMLNVTLDQYREYFFPISLFLISSSLVLQQKDKIRYVKKKDIDKIRDTENTLIRLRTHKHSHRWPLPPNLLLLPPSSSASTSAPAALALVHFFFHFIFNDFIFRFVKLDYELCCIWCRLVWRGRKASRFV